MIVLSHLWSDLSSLDETHSETKRNAKPQKKTKKNKKPPTSPKKHKHSPLKRKVCPDLWPWNDICIYSRYSRHLALRHNPLLYPLVQGEPIIFSGICWPTDALQSTEGSKLLCGSSEAAIFSERQKIRGNRVYNRFFFIFWSVF